MSDALLASAFQAALAVADESGIGEARRVASRLAVDGGFDDTQAGKVAIVATELATNLLRHGRGGELLLQRLDTPNGLAVELMAVDRGPGMDDPERCLRDGYSTAGTAGNGLGAVRRLSDEFDLHSQRDGGTVVISRIARRPPYVPSRPRVRHGAVCKPMTGELVCGDAWRYAGGDDGFRAMVVDGLGHGGPAADASRAAVQSFDADPMRSPTRQIEAAHAALVGTRGAAAAVAAVEFETSQMSYAGIGNIAGHVSTTSASRGLVSHNGMLGGPVRKAQEFRYDWTADSLLVMHSDGLATRWQLDKYPGLSMRHPALIAGVLYRDFSRGRDDVTVLVASARGVA